MRIEIHSGENIVHTIQEHNPLQAVKEAHKLLDDKKKRGYSQVAVFTNHPDVVSVCQVYADKYNDEIAYFLNHEEMELNELFHWFNLALDYIDELESEA